jgi:hypothetical protein
MRGASVDIGVLSIAIENHPTELRHYSCEEREYIYRPK